MIRLLQHAGLLAGERGRRRRVVPATRRVPRARCAPSRSSGHGPATRTVGADRAASVALGRHEGHARRHDRVRRNRRREHRRAPRAGRSRGERCRRRPRSRRRAPRLPSHVGRVARGDPPSCSPRVRADGRRRRSGRDRQRDAAPRHRRRAKESRRGIRAHRRPKRCGRDGRLSAARSAESSTRSSTARPVCSSTHSISNQYARAVCSLLADPRLADRMGRRRPRSRSRRVLGRSPSRTVGESLRTPRLAQTDRPLGAERPRFDGQNLPPAANHSFMTVSHSFMLYTSSWYENLPSPAYSSTVMPANS